MTGWIYFGITVLALVGLLALKYFKAWPIFCVYLASNILQSFVRLQFGDRYPSDHAAAAAVRDLAIKYWLPLECLAIILLCVAVGEILWRGMSGMSTRHKVTVCGSLVAMQAFTLHGQLHFLNLPHYADWFQELTRSYLTAIEFSVGAVAVFAFGNVVTINARACPHYTKFHSGIFLVLSVGSVWLTDFSNWAHSDAMVRWLKVSCLLGFCVNASLLRLQGKLWGLREWQAAPRPDHVPFARGSRRLRAHVTHGSFPVFSPSPEDRLWAERALVSSPSRHE